MVDSRKKKQRTLLAAKSICVRSQWKKLFKSKLKDSLSPYVAFMTLIFTQHGFQNLGFSDFEILVRDWSSVLRRIPRLNRVYFYVSCKPLQSLIMSRLVELIFEIFDF